MRGDQGAQSANAALSADRVEPRSPAALAQYQHASDYECIDGA
jgi:hypothetical protein